MSRPRPAHGSRSISPATATRAASATPAPSSSSWSSTSSRPAGRWRSSRASRTSRTRTGMSVVLTVSGDRHAPAAEWIDGVLRRRPVGVILVFSDIAHRVPREAALARHPVRDRRPRRRPVARRALGRLGQLVGRAHGHPAPDRARPPRIAAITGPEDMMCSHARVDGYRSAMNAAGLPIDPALIRFGDFHTTGGELHGRELLRVSRPSDGDLRRQRPAGARRHRGGARPRPSRARRPLRRRLRRHRAVAMDEPAADHRPPAAAADGRGGDAARAPAEHGAARDARGWISRRTSSCAAAPPLRAKFRRSFGNDSITLSC